MRIKHGEKVFMKINKLIRLLCSWHTIRMLDTSGKRHLREIALVVGVQAVEGPGAKVQGGTGGAWSRTSGRFCSIRKDPEAGGLWSVPGQWAWKA